MDITPWKAKPQSNRSMEDHKLLLEIKQSYDDSYGIYGSPRIHRDLREAGFNCGVKRVARLMHQANLKSICGYKRPRYKSGKPSIAAPNRLQHNRKRRHSHLDQLSPVMFEKLQSGS